MHKLPSFSGRPGRTKRPSFLRRAATRIQVIALDSSAMALASRSSVPYTVIDDCSGRKDTSRHWKQPLIASANCSSLREKNSQSMGFAGPTLIVTLPTGFGKMLYWPWNWLKHSIMKDATISYSFELFADRRSGMPFRFCNALWKGSCPERPRSEFGGSRCSHSSGAMQRPPHSKVWRPVQGPRPQTVVQCAPGFR